MSTKSNGSTRRAAHAGAAISAVLSLFIWAHGSAQAAEPIHGISDAYAAYQSVVTRMDQGDLRSPVSEAVHNLVHEGFSVLREAGESRVADQYEREWNEHYNRVIVPGDFVFDLAGKNDLGDHPPASAWLAKFYDTLMARTGGIIRSIRIINDINTLNYALPVVFAPRGTWRTGVTNADQIEYRKHFIPFSKIVTYWAAKKGCEYACAQYAPNLKFVCEPAATSLEWYMGRHVAWRISDKIYAMANGGRRWVDSHDSDWSISAETFEDEMVFMLGLEDLR